MAVTASHQGDGRAAPPAWVSIARVTFHSAVRGAGAAARHGGPPGARAATAVGRARHRLAFRDGRHVHARGNWRPGSPGGGGAPQTVEGSSACMATADAAFTRRTIRRFHLRRELSPLTREENQALQAVDAAFRSFSATCRRRSSSHSNWRMRRRTRSALVSSRGTSLRRGSARHEGGS